MFFHGLIFLVIVLFFEEVMVLKEPLVSNWNKGKNTVGALSQFAGYLESEGEGDVDGDG